MEEFDPQEEQALRAQLGEARARLDGLVAELQAADRELEGLAPAQHRHQLLEQVCVGLEQLADLNAAQLFWGDRAGEASALGTLRQARGRVEAFRKRIEEVEERRQAVLEEVERAHEASDFIADDLLEAERRAEQKRAEWLIEREGVEFPIRVSTMPWTRGGEDDRRFRKALTGALLASLLLGLALPWIDLPLPERWETPEVPERFARLIQEERPLPPPPPRVEESKPQELEPEPAKELLAEEPAPKAPQAKPSEQPGSKGILAFREKFSNLAQSDPAARLGAQARISRAGEAAMGRPTRNMVATTAPGSSGGINLASLSRDVGGGGGELAGVQVARATSSIGSGTGSERPLGGGPGLGRTDEEIQIVFDRHKAALYRLYNRELRRDPTLRGQMVLRLTIEPDGSVSLCRLQSSDMRAPELASQVVARVASFDFGAKDVAAITILYPIDFLPAT